MSEVDVRAGGDLRVEEATYWLLQAIESVTEFGRAVYRARCVDAMALARSSELL